MYSPSNYIFAFPPPMTSVPAVTITTELLKLSQIIKIPEEYRKQILVRLTSLCFQGVGPNFRTFLEKMVRATKPTLRKETLQRRNHLGTEFLFSKMNVLGEARH